ncbi:MAG: flagellar biosynthesis anti-sigma factor FlgM [Desulfovibrio sp.]|jgi:negative regulator of flagellin synthesis FlgM|nr:flagellar biosynthesis anti-sigma factor FlgM [Desulfovibrio sp.]
MEIQNSLLKNIEPYRAQLDSAKDSARIGDAKSGAPAPVASTPGGDRVSLSQAARLHTLAYTEAGNAPEIRQEKVDGLKERVSNGSYVVDSKKVAEKLVQSEALLAGALRPAE